MLGEQRSVELFSRDFMREFFERREIVNIPLHVLDTKNRVDSLGDVGDDDITTPRRHR